MNKEQIFGKLKELCKLGLMPLGEKHIKFVADWHMEEVRRIVEPIKDFRQTRFTIEATKSYSYVIMVEGCMDETLKRANGG